MLVELSMEEISILEDMLFYYDDEVGCAEDQFCVWRKLIAAWREMQKELEDADGGQEDSKGS